MKQRMKVAAAGSAKNPRAKKPETGSPSDDRSRAGAEHAPHDSVQTLSRMIKDLEDQLDRMLAINEAFEKDLEHERQKGAQLERTVADLEEELQRAEQGAAGKDDLLAEITHLNGERARLTGTVEELTHKVKGLEQESRKQAAMVERLRAGRADALEELQSVEAQFDRAMEMVADLRTRMTVMAEEHEAMQSRVKLAESRLQASEEERDALLSEVEESRTALDDIRRSLVDACVVSERTRSDI